MTDLPQYDPRTIALVSELIHPPIQLEPGKVQGVHNELYQHPEFAYQNFGVAADGITLTNVTNAQNTQSLVRFMPDRIHIREEFTGQHVDDFARRLEHVTRIAVERMSIPIIIAQQHVVRSLVNAKHFADSREFLAGVVCSIPPDDFARFARPVELFGLRLLFPAVEGRNDVHAVRIESYAEDARAVWIEDVATFTTALMPASLEELGNNMRKTYKFVRENVLGFLGKHDQSPKRGPEA
ncbi:MAG: hypothetical protein H6832_12365 [Planctomycetes bacterium]|nr:hypothetical protein [Planctomycetota bacterium]MCB9919186.1 hypothetical protein [Planctomycetota bacterium]